MAFITIDEKLCKNDGICVDVCPQSLISLNKLTGIPEAINEAESRCIKCGHCVAVCPHGAITTSGISVIDCKQINSTFQQNPEQVEQLIKTRRSIRKFQNKEVTREVLSRIIDVARYSPSAGNSQQVQWLVIYSTEEVKKLADEVINFFKELMGRNHPMVEKYNLHTLIKRYESGNDVIFRGAPALVIAHAPREYKLASIDCSLALAYADLAANSFDLGCCWAGFFMIAGSASPAVLNFLNLPEGNMQVGSLMIGYPKHRYHRSPPRKEARVLWRK